MLVTLYADAATAYAQRLRAPAPEAAAWWLNVARVQASQLDLSRRYTDEQCAGIQFGIGTAVVDQPQANAFGATGAVDGDVLALLRDTSRIDL